MTSGSMTHPQKFRLTGRRIGTREWLGLAHMKEGVDYERIEPVIVAHLPPGEWLYDVIGEGNEDAQCRICHPDADKVIDNRGGR